MEETMVNLEVLNPVAEISKTDISPATRFNDLSGKTVGLFWNGKPSGEIVNQFTAELLAKKVKDIHFRNYMGSLGSVVRQMSTEDADTIAKECGAVVGAVGD
jgi:hypothetical protein